MKILGYGELDGKFVGTSEIRAGEKSDYIIMALDTDLGMAKFMVLKSYLNQYDSSILGKEMKVIYCELEKKNGDKVYVLEQIAVVF